jgi:hypothetical protein
MPLAQFRYRSATHEGVAWLEVDLDADPESMVGCYYTDRKTTGDIVVKRTRDFADRELTAVTNYSSSKQGFRDLGEHSLTVTSSQAAQ